MINLLPIGKVIAGFAVIYGVIVSIILWARFKPTTTLLESVSIALTGSAIINILLLTVFYFGWRTLWKKIPSLNRLLFPDLNGEWDVNIDWNWDGKTGKATAKAHIKQDFLKISMEMESDKSSSETLLAKPKKDSESGRPILYYIYRNIPKNINGKVNLPYEGAAILKLDHTNLDCLKGNYFTSRSSSGHYQLTRKIN